MAAAPPGQAGQPPPVVQTFAGALPAGSSFEMASTTGLAAAEQPSAIASHGGPPQEGQPTELAASSAATSVTVPAAALVAGQSFEYRPAEYRPASPPPPSTSPRSAIPAAVPSPAQVESAPQPSLTLGNLVAVQEEEDKAKPRKQPEPALEKRGRFTVISRTDSALLSDQSSVSVGSAAAGNPAARYETAFQDLGNMASISLAQNLDHVRAKTMHICDVLLQAGVITDSNGGSYTNSVPNFGEAQDGFRDEERERYDRQRYRYDEQDEADFQREQAWRQQLRSDVGTLVMSSQTVLLAMLQDNERLDEDNKDLLKSRDNLIEKLKGAEAQLLRLQEMSRRSQNGKVKEETQA
eukprot:TRINITY_DN5095_c0_g1_i1.p1 TRINITY_DN5095_c0_g1~~TRINITY_DN5095_c0_g1_i1.p1  ORF type:complete len:352 (+),score=81.84 TRINITY_DN5095_c0_g1_i1:76-1131(+)